jgi:hypothetical protein
LDVRDGNIGKELALHLGTDGSADMLRAHRNNP